MRVTIAMCEGPHDVAFLSRIMHADGYHTYNKAISNYPPFIADFMKRHIIRGSLVDLNLKEARGGLFLPSFALTKDDDCLLLLFQLRGDSRKESRLEIVVSFDTLFRITADGTGKLIKPGDALSIVYIYDADEKGINVRIKEINSELEEMIGSGRAMTVTQAGFDRVNGIKYGAFIFHIPDDEDGHGRLEDLVLPLMSQTDADIRKDVDTLLSKRTTRAYTLFAQKNKDRDSDFNEQKAAIGMMGQLQKSGSPNSAIIEQSAFIEDSQILADAMCCQIIAFINSSFE